MGKLRKRDITFQVMKGLVNYRKSFTKEDVRSAIVAAGGTLRPWRYSFEKFLDNFMKNTKVLAYHEGKYYPLRPKGIREVTLISGETERVVDHGDMERGFKETFFARFNENTIISVGARNKNKKVGRIRYWTEGWDGFFHNAGHDGETREVLD